MREEKRKAPRLRFPGFDGDWEQRKLFDCIKKITDFRGRTPKKLGMDWSENGYLALSALNVKDGYIDFSQDVHYGSQELYDKWMTGNELHKGQVLFTTEAPMGNVAQVPDNARYILSQRTIAFDVKDELITENFLATVLRTPTVFSNLASLSSGGTAKGVSQKSLSSVEIRIPRNLDEQEKIASTFLNIDNLITLHQRKLDQMKEYKKGMLQKMFPKKGETVPEVRFPGFEGDWEEKKLGQLFSFVKTKNTNGLIDNVITNSAEYGLIPQREYFDKDIAIEGHTDNYTIIEKGNFVYNPRKSTSAPYGPFNCYMLDERGVVSPLYTCLDLKKPEYAEYLIWYFKTDKWHPYIQNNGAQGGARHDRVGMTNELMKGIPILLPSVSEQKKIGEFFENLDSLITLQQHKINEMKEYKKGLLQQMFV